MRIPYGKMLLLEKYLPILILFFLAALVPLGMVVMGSLMGPRRATRAKVLPFECGNQPIGEPRKRFSVQFFLVALLFVIFDVEVVFIFPWAVLFRKLGLYGFIEMSVFLALLIFGLFYVWKKGALEWE